MLPAGPVHGAGGGPLPQPPSLLLLAVPLFFFSVFFACFVGRGGGEGCGLCPHRNLPHDTKG